MTTKTIAAALGEWAATKEWNSVKPDHQDVVVNALVDTVGVGLVGSREPLSEILRTFVAENFASGEARIWGTDRRISAPAAALANGAAAHALDFDDMNSFAHNHPSAVLFPALIAIGEARDLSPEAILAGYAVGTGVMCALSELYRHSHYSKGWHSTSTVGTTGVAAAVAKALGGDAERIVSAMTISVSMASGLRGNFGTMTKPLHAGWAARNGVEAALLAEAHFTSSPMALEGNYGAMALFGEGPATPEQTNEGAIRALIDLAEDGIEHTKVKFYPACGGTTLTIEATLKLREELPADSVINAVTVEIPRGANTPLIYDNPQTGLQAKFSLPYAVAVTLARGFPVMSFYTDEEVFHSETRELMGKVSTNVNMSHEDTSAASWLAYSDVAVEPADGSTHRVRQDAHPLWFTDDDADNKFRGCASQVLDKAATERLLGRLRTFEQLGSVRALLAD